MWLVEPLCWIACITQAVVFAYALLVVVIEQRALGRAAAPLRAGPLPRVGPVALEGTVLTDGTAAITVRIDEVGRYIDPNSGWRGLLFAPRRRGFRAFAPTLPAFWRWREFDRATTVSAFTLRLDDGTSVRILPDQNVYLVDDLVVDHSVEVDHRVRKVSLDHEERAFVTGVLRVDRNVDSRAPVGSTHVVRSGGQHRLFISTHAIDTVHRERARRYGYVALGALACGLLSGIATIALDSLLLPVLLTFLVGVLGFNAYRRMRPWWEGATFDDDYS